MVDELKSQHPVDYLGRPSSLYTYPSLSSNIKWLKDYRSVFFNSPNRYIYFKKFQFQSKIQLTINTS